MVELDNFYPRLKRIHELRELFTPKTFHWAHSIPAGLNLESANSPQKCIFCFQVAELRCISYILEGAGGSVWNIVSALGGSGRGLKLDISEIRMDQVYQNSVQDFNTCRFEVLEFSSDPGGPEFH